MSSDDDRVNLVLGYWPRLVRDLRGFGCADEDARDFAQDATIATLKRLDTIARGAEWVYLRTTARNRAINHATRRRETVPLEELPPRDESRSAEEALIAKQELERFVRNFTAAFEELPEETRHCVVLKRQGYGYKEIGAKLGLSWMAVQSKLYRAGKHFRNRLGDPPPGMDWIELAGGNDDHEA